MDYYSQLRAMNNAQAAYDGQEAPEYYEDDEQQQSSEPELSAEDWELGYRAWVASYQGGF